MSPLMQGRGLKQSIKQIAKIIYLVAPHAGAWIETHHILCYEWTQLSPLMQGRGLKLWKLYASITKN